MKTDKGTRKKTGVELYFARSGPKRGMPLCEVAFETKAEALAFLANQHGLSGEETRTLSRELSLGLNPKWHGAERCAIEPTVMRPAEARRALGQSTG